MRWSLGVVFVLVGAAIAGLRPSSACTTILVGKSLTTDGSVIHALNEDMGNDAVGRVWSVAPTRYEDGATLEVPYVELPQVPVTFGYWASGNAQGAAARCA